MATKPKPRKAAAKPKTVNHGLTAKAKTKPKPKTKPKTNAKPKSRVVVLEQHGAGFLGKIFPVLGAMGL